MISEIITVGTELLIGSVVNTNGPYLSRLLTNNGYDVLYHSSVQDKEKDIRQALERALTRSNIIFLSGGMGPTKDDMTKEVVAKTLGLELIEDSEAWEKIKLRLSYYSDKITSNNRKQAQVVKGSTLIPNPNGSAPGDYISYKGKKIFLLPGPPKEFEPMAEYILKEYLFDTNITIFIESLNLVFIGESSCESIIRELDLEDEFIEINTFAKTNEVEVKIIAHSQDKKDYEIVKKKFDHAVETLESTFEENIYAKGDTCLENEIVKLLSRKHLTVSFAESITGGLLSHMITSIPNASNILKQSYVTYSNRAKIELLGIQEKSIEEYGVVSKEVALEMAKGCYNLSESNYCIGTTGEAGPSSSTGKDPGTLCYSILRDGQEILSEEVKFNGNRTDVQLRAAKYVLSKLIFMILGGNNGEGK